ncbi:MAG: PilN domain-containing protein [Patescibacteria group bacterium]
MINLLPEETKEKNRAAYRVRLVTVGLALLTLLSLSWSAFFLPIFLAARSQKALLSEEIVRTQERIKNGEAAGVADEVKKINARLSFLAGNTLDLTPPSVFVTRLLAHVPSGVTLTGASYDRGKELAPGATLRITGIGASREAVLAFSKALAAEPLFTSVESPISNLVRPSKISFTISAKIVSKK